MNEKDRNEGCTLDQVRADKPEAMDTFGRLARVGDGYGLKVNLERAPDARVVLPKEINGVPVRTEVVGTIRKRVPA